MVLHAFFQGTNPLAQPLAQFRQLLRTENQQCNGKNDDQMRRLKQTLKHGTSRRHYGHFFFNTVPEVYGEVKPSPVIPTHYFRDLTSGSIGRLMWNWRFRTTETPPAASQSVAGEPSEAQRPVSFSVSSWSGAGCPFQRPPARELRPIYSLAGVRCALQSPRSHCPGARHRQRSRQGTDQSTGISRRRCQASPRSNDQPEAVRH